MEDLRADASPCNLMMISSFSNSAAKLMVVFMTHYVTTFVHLKSMQTAACSQSHALFDAISCGPQVCSNFALPGEYSSNSHTQRAMALPCHQIPGDATLPGAEALVFWQKLMWREHGAAVRAERHVRLQPQPRGVPLLLRPGRGLLHSA
jgi:hypothetical protein